jgi:XTP/dITP diphosphohydrolase
MEIFFATGNRHKMEEAQRILLGSGIKVSILNADKNEPEDWTIEQVAARNAERIASETGKTVIVEDTGIFFDAFDNFPGNKPKRWFDQIGFEGLLGKFYENGVEIRNRKCTFKTVIGYCEPSKKPMLFEGTMEGTVAREVSGLDKDVMAYEKIVVYKDGRYLCDHTREEKDKISHRSKAFEKLREFLESEK